MHKSKQELTSDVNANDVKDSIAIVDSVIKSKKFSLEKSGYLFSKDKEHAVELTPTETDTENIISLYEVDGGRKVFLDSLRIGEVLGIQCDFIFADYNFDGQIDLYVQATVSNGLAFSYGYLIIMDKDLMKMREYKEARNLASIYPNPQLSIVFSDSLVSDFKGNRVYKQKNKWINGKLVQVR